MNKNLKEAEATTPKTFKSIIQSTLEVSVMENWDRVIIRTKANKLAKENKVIVKRKNLK